MSVHKYDSYMRGVAWRGIKTFLLEAAVDCGVDVTFTNETGFIVKTYFFTVQSDNVSNLKKFNSIIKATVEMNNND